MRQRFRPEEKELLTQGNKIEVHISGGNWVAAFVTDPTIVRPTPESYCYWSSGQIVGREYTNGKRMTTMVTPGQAWRITPGNVRPVGSDWKVT